MDGDTTVVEALKLGIDADEEALGIKSIMRIRIGRLVIVTMETVEGLTGIGSHATWPNSRMDPEIGAMRARQEARRRLESMILRCIPRDGSRAVGFGELTRRARLGPVAAGEPGA